jgi:predicted ATPase
MLKKIIKYNKERIKYEGDIEFNEGVNILIGLNGSGKSTIINYLIKASRGEKVGVEIEVEGKFSVYSHDFEKDNPRMKGSLANSKSIGFDIVSHFNSHGEVSIQIINKLKELLKESPTLVIMDEPETALDTINLLKLKGLIEKLSKKGHQVVIATHSPILWGIKGKKIVLGGYEGYRKVLGILGGAIKELEAENEST